MLHAGRTLLAVRACGGAALKGGHTGGVGFYTCPCNNSRCWEQWLGGIVQFVHCCIFRVWVGGYFLLPVSPCEGAPTARHMNRPT